MSYSSFQTNESVFTIKTLIVDDDRPSITILSEGLSAYPDIRIVGTATTLEEGRMMIERERPDLLFLDVEFPGSDALALTDALQDYPGLKIVYYSSYRKYLLNALRMKVFDFLLKPFDAEDLDLILCRYRLDQTRSLRKKMPEAAVAVTDNSKPIAVTTVTNDKIIISPNNIVYFRYDNQRKLWEAVLNNLERFILKRNTNADVILNYGPNFVRTHKSYILNTAYLGVVTHSECRLLPPLDNISEIKISKNYRRDLLDRFYDI